MHDENPHYSTSHAATRSNTLKYYYLNIKITCISQQKQTTYSSQTMCFDRNRKVRRGFGTLTNESGGFRGLHHKRFTMRFVFFSLKMCISTEFHSLAIGKVSIFYRLEKPKKTHILEQCQRSVKRQWASSVKRAHIYIAQSKYHLKRCTRVALAQT